MGSFRGLWLGSFLCFIFSLFETERGREGESQQGRGRGRESESGAGSMLSIIPESWDHDPS